ncbi:MAG: cofactor-independent phosphoglycerate mutase [Planctomycetota bacterium]|jgi:2,3-bisphosphoglycerate-independent phosphoglycerate mutase
MKYAVVIPDGAADLPLEELDGKTPLAAAQKPNMDWIATNGKCGTVCNIPERMPCGSDVAMLSVLGYDPKQYYTGRAPLEAAARGIQIADDELAFRCNFVTIAEGIMEDYSAGHISTEEAQALIAELNSELASDQFTFHAGVSYRHLMTFKGDCSATTTPPHDILGKKVAPHMPKGKGSQDLRNLMEKSQKLLADHEVNVVRRDLGENAATSIWLWGQGKMPQLPSFAERFGIRGAVITAVDLVRGIAKLIGWELIEVPGATGYVDTNYAGKGAAAVEALDRFDLVVVHVEAPDEAGHNAEPDAKVKAIEQIDRHVVGPLLERLKTEGDEWRILVLPDHPTPCAVRTHTADAVPLAMAGKDVASVLHGPLTEETAAQSDLHIDSGCELMEYFLKIR